MAGIEIVVSSAAWTAGKAIEHALEALERHDMALAGYHLEKAMMAAARAGTMLRQRVER